MKHRRQNDDRQNSTINAEYRTRFLRHFARYAVVMPLVLAITALVESYVIGDPDGNTLWLWVIPLLIFAIWTAYIIVWQAGRLFGRLGQTLSQNNQAALGD